MTSIPLVRKLVLAMFILGTTLETGHSQGVIGPERFEDFQAASRHNARGYTVFFPVQRFICKTRVEVNGPEVLAKTAKWDHYQSMSSGIHRGNSFGVYEQVYGHLLGKKEFQGLFDQVVGELLTESRVWGLDSVQVATSFVQSFPYVIGETEKYPSEALANHYGDCSDMSMLLLVLLRGMGIRSELFIYKHYRHATLGLPLTEEGKEAQYAFIECTSPSPIGRVSLDDIGRGFTHEDSLYLDTGNPNAKIPYRYPYKKRGSVLYQNFSNIAMEDAALESTFGKNYARMDIAKRLKVERSRAQQLRKASPPELDLVDDLMAANDRWLDADALLSSRRDSLHVMCIAYEGGGCLSHQEEGNCAELAQAMEAVFAQLPLMEMALKAAEMELDMKRIQWNNVVVRNPWCLE